MTVARMVGTPTHRTHAVRREFVARLTGLRHTGRRVRASRAYLDADVAPGSPTLSIYLTREASDPAERMNDAEGGMPVLRECELAVVLRALETETEADDVVDEVALDVERAIHADPTLGGLVVWAELLTREVARDVGRERPVTVATMTFRVDYQVDARDPQ